MCKWWFPNGGSSLVRRANSSIPFQPQFYLCFYVFFTSFFTPAQPAISNHGLQTTVYRPCDFELDDDHCIMFCHKLGCMGPGCYDYHPPDSPFELSPARAHVDGVPFASCGLCLRVGRHIRLQLVEGATEPLRSGRPPTPKPH